MRTLLRHALTGQYYKSLGKWTTNPAQAHDFGFIARAMSFVRKTNCPNMEIDLQFDDPRRAGALRLHELLFGC
jgi:hypothetical protein